MKALAPVIVFLFCSSLLMADTVINANITASATWDLAGSPYIINGNRTISGSTNPVVTVEPGVVVKFNSGATLYIGSTSSSSVGGGLIVNGTAENPVLFTANSDTPAPGFWNYLRTNVHASTDQVVCNHAIFEYGGSSSGLWDINGGNPQFTNCTFRYSAAYGIYHYSSSASATVQGCLFQDNLGYPLHFNADLAYKIGTGNTFVNNGQQRILLRNENVETGQTWLAQPVPYELTGNLSVRNLADPLVLSPGTQVLFRDNNQLLIGNTGSSAFAGSIQATGVTFGAANPAVGWSGIDFQNYTQASQLTGCTIQGVNSNTFGAIRVRCNNLVAIQDCVFDNNLDYALYCGDGANFSFSGCTVQNCTNTVYALIQDIHKLGTGNLYVNNTDNRIHCGGGRLEESCTWTRQAMPIFVMANISFYGTGTPTVVMPYGTVLEFNAQTNFSIGNTGSSSLGAILRATGVTFRGQEPSSGYWNGLTFNIFGGNSLLSGCVVRDAGYNNTNAVTLNVPSVTITGSWIYNCAAKGIYVAATSYPSLSGNMVAACGSYPLSMPADNVRMLGEGNSFTGNAIDRVEVRAENITASGTWRNPGVPYYLTGNITVSGSANPHLVIQPGSVIMLPDQTTLTIGSSSSSSLRGSIEATGVTFTRSAIDAIPSGLVFQPWVNTGMNLFTDCTFEYYRHPTNNYAIYVNNSDPAFESCTFRYNLGDVIVGTTNARPVINNCSFLSNGGYPARISASSFDVASGTGNIFSGNNPDRILLTGGILGQNYTWNNPSVPVEVSSDIDVYGTSNPILKINSGLELLFRSGVGMYVGNSSTSSLPGGIQADGAIFSALSGAMGGWEGLRLLRYLNPASYLRNCVLEYAGGNGNLGLNYTTIPVVEECVIRYGAVGIRCTGSQVTASIIRNHILSNEKGILCESSANPLIGGTLGDGNAIVGNTQYGVQNTTTTLTVNAEYNWWGDASGPVLRIGDGVSDHVDYDPWRTTNIGDAPGRFHLLTPASASVVETLTPVIDWEDSIDPSPGDAVYYTLLIAANAGFTSGLITVDGLWSSVYHVPASILADDSRYYWKVSATDTQTQTTWSYENYFWFDTAVPEPPAAFCQLEPADEATVYVTSPMLTWQPAIDPDPGDVVTYTVYRDLTAGFESPEAITAYSAYAYPGYCVPGEIYYWKVKATDTTGHETFSDTWSFFVDPAAVPRAPADLTIQSVGADILVSWDLVPGADYYDVYASSLPDGGFTFLGQALTNQYTDAGAAAGTRKFYRVVAIDYQ
jgi:hypothetical protein